MINVILFNKIIFLNTVYPGHTKHKHIFFCPDHNSKTEFRNFINLGVKIIPILERHLEQDQVLGSMQFFSRFLLNSRIRFAHSLAVKTYTFSFQSYFRIFLNIIICKQ